MFLFIRPRDIMKAVHWEQFYRSKLWRGIAIILLLTILIFSLYKADRIWAIILLCFVGIYGYYTFYQIKKEHSLSISSDWLTIDTIVHSWDQIEWYSIWYMLYTKEFHTLYLYLDDETEIFTLLDSQDNIKQFAADLSVNLELISPPRIPPVRKLMRILRI